jgi:hypothetical protein
VKRDLDLTRAFRKVFGSGERTTERPFHAIAERQLACAQLVKIFYLISVFWVADNWSSIHRTAASAPRFDYVWPLYWAMDLPPLPTADTLGLLAMLAALFAFRRPDLAIFRIAFPVLFLPFVATDASMGGMSHGHHVWFWMAVMLAFLPKPVGRAGKLAYCLTIALAQGLMLFFYSLAGLWKTLYGLSAIVAGAEGNFSPRGLALTLADRSVQTGTEPLFVDFVIENYWLSWPMFLLIIYAQLVAIVIAVRPALHRAWGLIFVAFHTGTFFLMEISFSSHIFLVMLFLVASPFQTENWLRLATIRQLPGIGLLRIPGFQVAPKPRPSTT